MGNQFKRQRVRKIIGLGILMLLVFIPSLSESASRLIYWTFDDATHIDSGGGDTGAEEAARAIYASPGGLTTNAPSPGSGGKSILAFVSTITNPERTMPALGHSGNWGLREFYVKFYMYIHNDITDAELGGIKLFEVSDSTNPIDLQTGNWLILDSSKTSIYLYSSGNANGNYFASWNGWMRGGWHKFEFYIKYNTVGQSNGIARVWIDGVLKGEDTAVNYWNSNVVVNTFSAVYHMKTFGSQVGNIEGYMQIDDIELWNGMPATDPAPSPPLGLRIVQ